MRLQVPGKGAQVDLGATDVVAGFVVACFGEGRHGDDGGVLDQREFAGAAPDFLFEVTVAVAQEIAGGLQVEVVADAGQDEGRTDRLGDVVDGAGVEAELFVQLFVADGQENNRDAGGDRVVHELPADFVAVHVGHGDVEQDEVGQGRGGGEPQCAFAAGGDAGAEVGLVQAGDDGLDGIGCVIDDEDERAVAVDGLHQAVSPVCAGCPGSRAACRQFSALS